METGVVIAVAASIVVAGLVVWFARHIRRGTHPEDTAGHESTASKPPPTSRRMAPYPGQDRPAGPGAEPMGAVVGDAVPGPEAPQDRSGAGHDPELVNPAPGGGDGDRDGGSRQGRPS